jgi:membrane-bound lytic murein transglycosylase MltF
VLSSTHAPHIATIDDLAGKQIYVRKSSNAYHSLTMLNIQFKKQGKPEILLKLAPDNLEDEDMMDMLNAGLEKFLVVDSFIATFWK